MYFSQHTIPTYFFMTLYTKVYFPQHTIIWPFWMTWHDISPATHHDVFWTYYRILYYDHLDTILYYYHSGHLPKTTLRFLDDIQCYFHHILLRRPCFGLGMFSVLQEVSGGAAMSSLQHTCAGGWRWGLAASCLSFSSAGSACCSGHVPAHTQA